MDFIGRKNAENEGKLAIASYFKCLGVLTRWYRLDSSVFNLPEIRGPYNSNYAWSLKVLSEEYSAPVEENQTEAIEYWKFHCTSTVQFLVVYKLRVKHFIKLPYLKLVKLIQKRKITVQFWINNALQLQRVNYPSCVIRDLNGTDVLQSIDLQTEKVREPKNQNDCSWHNRMGPRILLAAQVWLE